MKTVLQIACCLCMALCAMACADDEDRLTNKWQLRRCEYADGTVKPMDNVFYNFQKGSFSAICLHTDSKYYTFYGLYTLQDNELVVSIEEFDDFAHPVYATYLGWENGKRTFKVDALEQKKLILSHDDTTLVFRKY